MQEGLPSSRRLAAAFLTGGVLASVATGLVFQVFFPLGPALQSRSYLPEAFVVTHLVMFPSGALVAGRCMRARVPSDLIPCVLGTYIAVIAVSLIGGLQFNELAPPLGLATTGMIASATSAFILSRRIPWRWR